MYNKNKKMEHKLAYQIEEEIGKLKSKISSKDEFYDYHLGLIEGFYTVLSMMKRINEDAKVTKNAHDTVI